jgi:hypothetical protein
MPQFFIPLANSSEQAEEIYAAFRGQNHYGTLNRGRLFRISYDYRGKLLRPQVGEDFKDFPAPVGIVLAIIESAGLVTVHTAGRGGLSASPILVSPSDITRREYFEDCPP